MFNVLFAFLNFGVVAGFLYYGWNRFGLPAIRSAAEKELADMHMLHEEHHRLLKECETLDTLFIAQEAECKTLSAKVMAWREVAEAAQVSKADERVRMQKNYAQKIEEQVEKHRNALLYQKVKPLVIAQVQEDLRQHFENPAALHLYMNRLLQELNNE